VTSTGGVAGAGRSISATESLLRAAIAQRADVPHWHFELRNVLGRTFRPNEALAEAKEAVRLDPNSAQFRKGLSQIYLDRGEYNDGYNTILDALARDQEHPEAQLHLPRWV
jgi:predicted Zn-dependent protease